ncbi:MAG: IclR family transcriptional regulator [Rubrivivax sp.]|nr:IclR family transcriptional regulator [Rubrivivax sp.]
MSEVKSAKRVLEILRFFAQERSPASLARVSAALSFPKSSCLALLETLMAEGYAYQVDGRYYLTARWLHEAEAVTAHDPLAQRLRPVLEKLQQTLGETVILAKLAGTKVVYLDVVEADHVLRFSAHVGQVKPAHASASGRALLSVLPDAEIGALTRAMDFERFTAATLTSPAALLELIGEGRRRGWHVNLGEFEADTLSVAVPARVGGVPVAFVVGAPMSRAAKHVDRIGRELARATANLRES